MGGTDDPANIKELTIEEHALEHKRLFEQHGHWQDYIAWQGLSGRISCEEVIRETIRNTNMRNKYCVGRKYSDETIANFSKMRKGKRHSSKITLEDADFIRKQFADKVQLTDSFQSLIGKVGRHGRVFEYTSLFCREFGEKYGIHANGIRSIVSGRTWKAGVQDARK
jgi:hypothetical protein